MVAETASIVVGGGQHHSNKLMTPIRLILLLFVSFDWTITWTLATSSVKQNIDGDERMCLHHMPFLWSCGRVEAKHVTSPNGTRPGLHQKPLDATIGQLLAPYRLGGRQGDNQQNDDAKCTHFADRFDGHRDVAVLYRAHCQMEEVHGFHKSH